MEPGASPPVDRLEALRDALGHRGPDDSGIEVIENVGLVHTRLAIVDPGPSSHQPMRHPGGSYWITYNGEVYNHQALRSEFDTSSFASGSDTETVLWALERSGLEAVSRFDGQFAFAALDLESRTLHLCRDRFGIKPLYIAAFDGGVWFASEPAALIRAGAPACPIDAAYGAILSGSRYGGPETLVEGIARMGAGVWMSIPLDGSAMSSGRWFAPALEVDSDRAERLARRSRRELAGELEETLRAAVHRSLMSDVQVGALLSGGVDSSLITALAVQAQPDLVAFGATYAGDATYEEGGAARAVATELGIELDLIEVTPQSWREEFVAATAHFGSPLTNASAVTVAQMARRAHDAGVKVLLTGEGADELFGGYDSLYADALQGFKGALDPTPTLTWTHLSTPPGGPDFLREALLAYAHHPADRCRAEATLLSRMDFTLCWLLNRMDKNLMQSSVEGRVPFLEPDVVRLVLNLPLEARIGPLPKGILRDVAESMLPLSIARRPKIAGMDFDAGAWIEEAADPAFLSHGLLRETLAVPQDEFERSLASEDGRRRMRIWSAEVWCRSQLAGHSIEQIEQALWRR